jgi:hypothetical protein
MAEKLDEKKLVSSKEMLMANSILGSLKFTILLGY